MNGRRVVLLAVGILLCGSVLGNAALAQNGGNSVQASAGVRNEPPTNAQVAAAGDEDAGIAGVQLSPLAIGPRVITVTGSAEDGNGWQDLRSASFRVFTPAGPPLTTANVAMVAADGTGRLRSFTGTFEMSAANPPGTYSIEFTVKDRADAEATARATFEWRGLLAFALGSTTLAFGESLGPGASSHASPASVAVQNTGSVPLDVMVSATPLTTPEGDASIPPDRIRYSRSADMSGEQPLSLVGYLDGGFDLAPGQSRNVYLDVHVPTGDEMYVPAAFYRGTVTIGGVVG